jgi:hypothetical protein
MTGSPRSGKQSMIDPLVAAIRDATGGWQQRDDSPCRIAVVFQFQRRSFTELAAMNERRARSRSHADMGSALDLVL